MMDFIYFIMGLVAAVLINLATPPLQKWLDGMSLINKNKKIKALKDELKYIEGLKTDSSRFLATIHLDLIFLAGIIVLVMILAVLAIYSEILSFQIPTFAAYVILGNVYNTKSMLDTLSVNFQIASQVFLYLVLLLMVLFGAIISNVYTRTRKIKQFDEYLVEINARIEQLERKNIHPPS